VKTILVTGSRDYADRRAVWHGLSDRLIKHGPFILRHGACPTGADWMAHEWWVVRGQRAGVIEDPHPADWKTHGKPAGFIRNAEMVALGADEALAFFADGAPNKGTQHTVDLATRAGIPVFAWGNFTGGGS
jgi:hypothetical protein